MTDMPTAARALSANDEGDDRGTEVAVLSDCPGRLANVGTDRTQAKTREAEQWPPDPASINLDDGSWLTIQQAAGAAKADERTIRRWVRERSIAIKTPGGRIWINRGRLFQPVGRSDVRTCPEASGFVE